METRDTARPSDGNENRDFWHAWNKAEARNWNELQEWSTTDYLRPGKLREPKPETNKARLDRRKRRMQEDPAYHEAMKTKERQKRQDRKKRGKAKKANAAAPSSDASVLQSGGGDTGSGVPLNPFEDPEQQQEERQNALVFIPSENAQAEDLAHSTAASSSSGHPAPMVKAASIVTRCPF